MSQRSRTLPVEGLEPPPNAPLSHAPTPPAPKTIGGPAVLRTWTIATTGFPGERPVGVRPDGSVAPFVIVLRDSMAVDAHLSRVLSGACSEAGARHGAAYYTKLDISIAKAENREPRVYEARRVVVGADR